MNETEELEFKINLEQLNKINLEIDALKERYSEIGKFYYEYEDLGRKLSRYKLKAKKIHNYLDNNKWMLDDELREIGKKIIEAKENHKTFDKNEDYLLFDELKEDFITFSKGKKAYHISLIYNHLRHYDVNFLLRRIEELTNLKIKEWYLMTSDNFGNPAWEISLILQKEEMIGEEKGK
jgi:DNA mismatch repair ATPase MutS